MSQSIKQIIKTLDLEDESARYDIHDDIVCVLAKLNKVEEIITSMRELSTSKPTTKHTAGDQK